MAIALFPFLAGYSLKNGSALLPKKRHHLHAKGPVVPNARHVLSRRCVGIGGLQFVIHRKKDARLPIAKLACFKRSTFRLLGGFRAIPAEAATALQLNSLSLVVRLGRIVRGEVSIRADKRNRFLERLGLWPSRGKSPRQDDLVAHRVEKARTAITLAVRICIAGGKRMLLGDSLIRGAHDREQASPRMIRRSLRTGCLRVFGNIGAGGQGGPRCRNALGIEAPGVSARGMSRGTSWLAVEAVSILSFVTKIAQG